MTDVCALLKEYVVPAGPTTGLGGYDLEGQRRRDWRKRMTAHGALLALVAKAQTVDSAAHEAATSPFNLKQQPTEGQQHAGNYAKGHVSVGGVDVAVENPAGSRRRPEWLPLTAHYGYAKRSAGADGDGVDVFIRVGTPMDYSGPVFVVDQRIGGKFDEHKCMIGWSDEASASAAYLSNYEDGWDGLGAVTRMSIAEFKDWLKDGDTKAPASRNFTQGE